jgi:hypothetical protein
VGGVEYRLYFLDDLGHIRRAVDLECDGDAAAIQAVEKHRDGMAMELWRRDHVVETFVKAQAETP